MLFYTVGQSRVFLAMLMAGIVMGVFYDLATGVKRLLAAGRWLGAFIDALCALGICAITIISLFLANRLELRLYALLGAVCGACLYMAAIAPVTRAVGLYILRIVTKIRRFPYIRQIFQFFVK